MKARRLLATFSTAALFLAAACPALASSPANRVFVSQRSGNDANSCDNILTPCKTFAGAVLQLNPGGEAIVLDSGGYGPVTITHSAIIEAPPGVLAFIHPPTPVDAITVNAPGATVVLRGLTIDGAGQGTGSGMNVVAVASLHVENCVVTGFAGTSGSSGNGIYFSAPGQLFVKDTIIRGNGGVGIVVSPASGTARASLDRCRLEENNFGVICDGSTGSAKLSISASVVSGNSADGLRAAGGAELNAEGCLVTNNGFAGLMSSGLNSILWASNCMVSDNAYGMFSAVSGNLVSRLNNMVQGNTTNGSFTVTSPTD